MKKVLLRRKSICWLLIVVITLQSCSVYQKNSVNLNEASDAKTKVLVTRINNQKVRFKKIVQIDSSFYGIKHIDGEEIKIPLNKNDIKSVKVLDKTATTFANIGLTVVSLGVIVIIILASGSNDYGGIGDVGTKQK